MAQSVILSLFGILLSAGGAGSSVPKKPVVVHKAVPVKMTRRSPAITAVGNATTTPASNAMVIPACPETLRSLESVAPHKNQKPIPLPKKTKKQIRKREKPLREEMLDKVVRVPHESAEKKGGVVKVAPQKKKKSRLWVLPVVAVFVLGAVLCWLRWQRKQARKGEAFQGVVVKLPDTSKCFGGSSFLPVVSPAGCHPRLSGIHSTDQTAGSGHRLASELTLVPGVAAVSINPSIDTERLRAFYQGELDLLRYSLEAMEELNTPGARKTAQDLRDQIAVIEATLAAI